MEVQRRHELLRFHFPFPKTCLINESKLTNTTSSFVAYQLVLDLLIIQCLLYFGLVQPIFGMFVDKTCCLFYRAIRVTVLPSRVRGSLYIYGRYFTVVSVVCNKLCTVRWFIRLNVLLQAMPWYGCRPLGELLSYYLF